MTKSKRFATYFGIPIPPFKEKKLGAGSTTIRFVITGKIPSKKNHQQAIAVRRNAKEYIRSLHGEKGSISLSDALNAIDMVNGKMMANLEYAKFLEEIKPVLNEQKEWWMARLREKGLTFPLYQSTMSLRLYFKDRYVTDTVNKQQTIQDVLIDCGIISNDDYNTLNPIYSASACYKDELIYNIAFISLSFRL